MPLSFSRAPLPYFNRSSNRKQINKSSEPAAIAAQNETDDFNRYHMYPLEHGDKLPQNQTNQSTVPVQPLYASKQRQALHSNSAPQQSQHRHRRTPQLQPHTPMIPPSLPHQSHSPMIPQPPQHQPHSPMIPQPSMSPHPQRTPHQPKLPPSFQAPPAPVSPEKAAAEFQRVNKNLPDGVRYEPLDDQTMQLLKDNGHLPKKTQTSHNPSPAPPETKPQKPTPQPAPVTPHPPDNVLNQMLQNLTQDEFNANIFYTHFAGNAPCDDTKETLTTLAADSLSRQNIYITLIERMFNRQFTPILKQIKLNIPFADAMHLALTEENKTLITLSNLLDQLAGTPDEKTIERVISKKLIANQLLFALSQNQTNNTALASESAVLAGSKPVYIPGL